MNEPRPTPSQPGVPHPPSHLPSQSHGPQHQGVPARPVAQPTRGSGVPPVPHPSHGSHAPHAPAAHPPQRVNQAILGLNRPPPAPVDDSPISLDDEEPIALEETTSAPVTPGAPRLPALGSPGAPAPTSAPASSVAGIAPGSKIKFYAGGDKHAYTKFKRQTHVTGTGACRVRSFHGRLSDDGLAFMDDKINEWLDNHPDAEVKFVNCFVGPLEGKVTGEQGLIVTIWY